MERTKRLPVYLSDEELQQCRIAAAQAGLSMSEWARLVLLAATDAKQEEKKQ